MSWSVRRLLHQISRPIFWIKLYIHYLAQGGQTICDHDQQMISETPHPLFSLRLFASTNVWNDYLQSQVCNIFNCSLLAYLTRRIFYTPISVFFHEFELISSFLLSFLLHALMQSIYFFFTHVLCCDERSGHCFIFTL